MELPDPSSTGAFDQAMPLWAKVIGYLGFPVVVASALLWVFTDQIRSDRKTLIMHDQMMQSHATITFQQYINQAQIGAATLRTLSQICANGAKTIDDRTACATVVIPEPMLPTPPDSSATSAPR